MYVIDMNMSLDTRSVPDQHSDFQGSSNGKKPIAALAALAALLWDYQDCVPLDKIRLGDNNPILLLTPVVVLPDDHNPNDNRDPFEILGQSLAGRNIPICHVPYTKTQGITDVHLAFIKRARAIIFVITGFPDLEGPSLQLHLATLVARKCDSRPFITIACCDAPHRILPIGHLPTVIRATGYSNADLRVTANLLLNGDPALRVPPSNTAWEVQDWEIERDLVETHILWQMCVPEKFHLRMSTLGAVLDRKGCAKHYVVREPTWGTLVGFCVTYTTSSECTNDLIGSIATIIVRPQYRGKGIGLRLHDKAVGELQNIQRIRRLQIGTTFPRLFCGLPIDMPPVIRWLKKRGWPIDGLTQGQGRLISDWVLQFSDLPCMTLASAGLEFKLCDKTDVPKVLDLLKKKASAKNQCFNWYDQYVQTLGRGGMGDIIVGFEGNIVVAAAIMYVPSEGGQTADNIPWPKTLGPDIGGVTCIYIDDENPDVVNGRGNIMIRLLHVCRRELIRRGMKGMFLDGVRCSENGLEFLGFRKWAEYREIWCHVRPTVA